MTIRCECKVFNIGSQLIARLPESASKSLPTRGQTMVEGILNGVPIHLPLEPDGKNSHWFEINSKLNKVINIKDGDKVVLKLNPSKNWIEPQVPSDLMKALSLSSEAYSMWQKITPLARWEWIRWIRSTGQKQTRIHRIEVTISKLVSGKRRPCCWNRNLCTEPSVSKNGILLLPSKD